MEKSATPNLDLFNALTTEVMLPVANHKLASVNIQPANADETAAVLALGTQIADRVEAAYAKKASPLTQHLQKIASALAPKEAPELSDTLSAALTAVIPD